MTLTCPYFHFFSYFEIYGRMRDTLCRLLKSACIYLSAILDHRSLLLPLCISFDFNSSINSLQISSNLGDLQYLYIDLVIITSLALVSKFSFSLFRLS